MADIFSSQPGRVTAVVGSGLPMQLIVGNPAVFDLQSSVFRDQNTSTFGVFRAIIQHLGVSGQSGVQFMHTLRDYIYVYVFGERVGELILSGLAFHSKCDDEFNPEETATGLERILNYYQSYRVTSYPLAITIAIGATVAFDAFLTGINAQLVNPETSLGQFSMRFALIPNQVDLLPEEGF